MPTAYIKKTAKKTGKSVKQVESLWNEAKASAAEQGKADNYAYITGIFKKMIKGLDKKSLLSEISESVKVILNKLNT